MNGRILVGTASWSDPGFVADWYPKTVQAADRLGFYAEHFNFVEVNSTFYGVPKREVVQRWCEQTPDAFIFDLKLPKILSRHSAKLENLPTGLRRFAREEKGRVLLTSLLERRVAEVFLHEVEPLQKAGKLGAFLLQLSPGFGPRDHELEELESLFEYFENFKLGVELRNRSWFKDERVGETVRFFKENHITLVGVDAPESEHFTVAPNLDFITNPNLSYLRLHGRNEEGYIRGRTVAERFNHQYTEAELQEIAQRVDQLSKQTKETHVVYNNNASDYAVKAAERFQEMVDAHLTAKAP